MQLSRVSRAQKGLISRDKPELTWRANTEHHSLYSLRERIIYIAVAAAEAVYQLALFWRMRQIISAAFINTRDEGA